MGKISQFNRRRLVSSAVGIPSVDQSGAVIGEAFADVGKAFTERQVALDKVTLTKKEYELKRAYNLERTELQAQFRENPEEFRQADEQLYQRIFSGVNDTLPDRLQGSFARVNSVSPLFEMGMVWAPMHQHFAQEVVEECAAFPFGDYDDYVDSMTQAIMRIKQGGIVRNKDSYKDEPLPDRSRLEYYG